MVRIYWTSITLSSLITMWAVFGLLGWFENMPKFIIVILAILSMFLALIVREKTY